MVRQLSFSVLKLHPKCVEFVKLFHYQYLYMCNTSNNLYWYTKIFSTGIYFQIDTSTQSIPAFVKKKTHIQNNLTNLTYNVHSESSLKVFFEIPDEPPCYIREFQSNSNVLYLINCGNKSKCFCVFYKFYYSFTTQSTSKLYKFLHI